MKGHPQVLLYLGFLRGALSKIFFLLFCSTIVLNAPMNGKEWYRDIGGYFLALISILQLLKYCRKDKGDQTNEEAVMEDA